MFYLSLLQAGIAFGQTSQEIDGLKDRFFQASNSEERAQINTQIAYQFAQIAKGTDSVHYYLNRASEQSSDSKITAYIEVLRKLTDDSAWESDCNAALSAAKKYVDQLDDDPILVDYYLQLGSCFSQNDDRLNSLKYKLLAEQLATEEHPKLHQAYTEIGILYDELEVFDKTLEYGLKAKALSLKNKDVSAEMTSILMITSATYQLQQFALLKEVSQRAIKITTSEDLDTSLGYIYFLLGKTAIDENELDLAIDHFNQGIQVSSESGDLESVSQNQEGMSMAMLEKGDIGRAKFYADEALKFETEYISDRGIYLSEVYSKAGDHNRAYDLLIKNIKGRLQQERSNNPRQILSAVLNDRFEQEKLREQERFEDELNFQRKIGNRNLLIGLAIILLLFLSFLFFYHKKRNEVRNRELKRLVDEQTLEIREQKERLENLDKFKSRLYTNITHEFRTPLTVILGMSNQLDAGLRSLPISKAKEKLSFIQRNGKNLLELINQMLDLSKLENNQLNTNFIQGDIVAYLRYISESFHSLANAQNVILKMEVEQPKIIMDYDAEKFRQIASNLLSNAIKYSRSGGKIWIAVKKIDQYLEFAVKDTGMGISEDHLTHVFDRFYQANDAVSKTGGTGIGLALTKELVELLEGTIKVGSVLGSGSTFTVQLPITNRAEEKMLNLDDANPLENHEMVNAFAVQNVDPLEGKVKIAQLLVVEDNLDVSEYIASCLEQEYMLDFAYNGVAGIEKAFELIPEIIISDVMMPEKDGFELCEALKNDERTSHIPIVLLTAKADVESKIAGLKKGADAYLKKPFHQEELIAVLNNLLESRKKLQAKYFQLATQFPSPTQVAHTDAMEDVFVTKLREAVEDRLGDASLKADDICKELGMGRSNLYAKMQSVLGMSFNIYLRTLRLNKAKALLLNSSLNVSEVAYEVGFNDPKYFSRIFSETFGVSPSKYNS